MGWNICESSTALSLNISNIYFVLLNISEEIVVHFAQLSDRKLAPLVTFQNKMSHYNW